MRRPRLTKQRVRGLVRIASMMDESMALQFAQAGLSRRDRVAVKRAMNYVRQLEAWRATRDAAR